MITEVANVQAQALDDWARQWSGDSAEGSSEVSFLLQRAARMIRRAAGVPIPVDQMPRRGDEQVGAEPLIARQHAEPAETRTELADG